jgi:hypothetical protein
MLLSGVMVTMVLTAAGAPEADAPDRFSRFATTLLGASVGVAAPTLVAASVSGCPHGGDCGLAVSVGLLVASLSTAPLLGWLGHRLQGGQSEGLFIAFWGALATFGTAPPAMVLGALDKVGELPPRVSLSMMAATALAEAATLALLYEVRHRSVAGSST